MGKFCPFLTELSACDTSGFSFLYNNEKTSMDFQQIALCIDIVEICCGNANEMLMSIFLSIFDRVICPVYNSGIIVSHFYVLFMYIYIYVCSE